MAVTQNYPKDEEQLNSSRRPVTFKSKLNPKALESGNAFPGHLWLLPHTSLAQERCGDDETFVKSLRIGHIFVPLIFHWGQYLLVWNLQESALLLVNSSVLLANAQHFDVLWLPFECNFSWCLHGCELFTKSTTCAAYTTPFIHLWWLSPSFLCQVIFSAKFYHFYQSSSFKFT